MHEDRAPNDLSVRDPWLSPEEELELAELRLRAAGLDEEETAFAPDVHPKDPHPKEEPVTDDVGERVVDVQIDTPTVDSLATFDFTAEDLQSVDLF